MDLLTKCLHDFVLAPPLITIFLLCICSFVHLCINLFYFDINFRLFYFYFSSTHCIQISIMYSCQIYHYVYTNKKRTNSCNFQVVLKNREHEIRPKKILKAILVQEIHLPSDFEYGEKS